MQIYRSVCGDICNDSGEECGLDNLMRIQGGRWAVSISLRWEIKDIFETLQGIFNVWLPRSGYRMAQRYGLKLFTSATSDREKHRVRMDLVRICNFIRARIQKPAGRALLSIIKRYV